MATEKRLIDANGAVEYCRNRWGMNTMTEKFLNAQPTVDAVEVVHGQMEEIEPCLIKVDRQCCSCGTPMGREDNYCPNCGAKMDGERRTE